MDQLLLYGWYCLASCVRYFVVAGLIYGCFNVWFHARWAALRIQDAPPGEGQIAHEIRWSLSTIACGGLAGLVVYDLVQHGWTRMYFDLARHGWPYFALTVVLGIVAYDAWFYWKHRLLHTSWLFRRAHHVHHRVTNPTPFANFTHHPLEIALSNVYFLVFVVAVPVHPLALAAISTFVFGWGMVAHLGYELYPRGFARGAAFRWINSATHHNLHHSHGASNYGLFFNFWDRTRGTNHPAYRATFDAIKARSATDVRYDLAVGV